MKKPEFSLQALAIGTLLATLGACAAVGQFEVTQNEADRSTVSISRSSDGVIVAEVMCSALGDGGIGNVHGPVADLRSPHDIKDSKSINPCADNAITAEEYLSILALVKYFDWIQ